VYTLMSSKQPKQQQDLPQNMREDLRKRLLELKKSVDELSKRVNEVRKAVEEALKQIRGAR